MSRIGKSPIPVPSGVDVSDNDIPNTPDYTASLGAQFNHAAGRYVEEVRGVRGVPHEEDKQLVLPQRHAGIRRRLERTPRQEE